MEFPAKKQIIWDYEGEISPEEWRRLKGRFGELFVKEFLEKKNLRVERMSHRGEGLPDFKVLEKPVMVEVKSHAKRRPDIWQKNSFISLRRLGWTILIAHPIIRRDFYDVFAICSAIKWYSFNQEGHLEYIPLCPL